MNKIDQHVEASVNKKDKMLEYLSTNDFDYALRKKLIKVPWEMVEKYAKHVKYMLDYVGVKTTDKYWDEENRKKKGIDTEQLEKIEDERVDLHIKLEDAFYKLNNINRKKVDEYIDTQEVRDWLHGLAMEMVGIKGSVSLKPKISASEDHWSGRAMITPDGEFIEIELHTEHIEQIRQMIAEKTGEPYNDRYDIYDAIADGWTRIQRFVQTMISGYVDVLMYDTDKDINWLLNITPPEWTNGIDRVLYEKDHGRGGWKEIEIPKDQTVYDVIMASEWQGKGVITPDGKFEEIPWGTEHAVYIRQKMGKQEIVDPYDIYHAIADGWVRLVKFKEYGVGNTLVVDARPDISLEWVLNLISPEWTTGARMILWTKNYWSESLQRWRITTKDIMIPRDETVYDMVMARQHGAWWISPEGDVNVSPIVHIEWLYEHRDIANKYLSQESIESLDWIEPDTEAILKDFIQHGWTRIRVWQKFNTVIDLSSKCNWSAVEAHLKSVIGDSPNEQMEIMNVDTGKVTNALYGMVASFGLEDAVYHPDRLMDYQLEGKRIMAIDPAYEQAKVLAHKFKKSVLKFDWETYYEYVDIVKNFRKYVTNNDTNNLRKADDQRRKTHNKLIDYIEKNNDLSWLLAGEETWIIRMAIEILLNKDIKSNYDTSVDIKEKIKSGALKFNWEMYYEYLDFIYNMDYNVREDRNPQEFYKLDSSRSALHINLTADTMEKNGVAFYNKQGSTSNDFYYYRQAIELLVQDEYSGYAEQKKLKGSKDAIDVTKELIKKQNFPNVNWKQFWKEYYDYVDIVKGVEEGLADDGDRESQHATVSEILHVGEHDGANNKWLMNQLEQAGVLEQLDEANYNAFGKIKDVNHNVRMAVHSLVEEDFKMIKGSNNVILYPAWWVASDGNVYEVNEDDFTHAEWVIENLDIIDQYKSGAGQELEDLIEEEGDDLDDEQLYEYMYDIGWARVRRYDANGIYLMINVPDIGMLRQVQSMVDKKNIQFDRVGIAFQETYQVDVTKQLYEEEGFNLVKVYNKYKSGVYGASNYGDKLPKVKSVVKASGLHFKEVQYDWKDSDGINQYVKQAWGEGLVVWQMLNIRDDQYRFIALKEKERVRMSQIKIFKQEDLDEYNQYMTDFRVENNVMSKVVDKYKIGLKSEEQKYGCLMVELPKNVADQIRNFVKNTIKDEDLYIEDGKDKFGREDEIHLTVLYGLKEDSAYGILESVTPVNIKLGNISRFSDDKKPYDVMIVEVESEDLRQLHDYVGDKFEHITTYSDYKPHITLAYIQKGACKDLDGKDGSIALQEAGMDQEPKIEFRLGDFYYVNPKDERFDKNIEIESASMSSPVYDGSEDNNTEEEDYFHKGIDNIKHLIFDDDLVDSLTNIAEQAVGDDSIKEDKPLKRQYIGDESTILKNKNQKSKSNSLDNIEDIDVDNWIKTW